MSTPVCESWAYKWFFPCHFCIFVNHIYKIRLKDFRKENKSYFWEALLYPKWVIYIAILICHMTKILEKAQWNQALGKKVMPKAAGGTFFYFLREWAKKFLRISATPSISAGAIGIHFDKVAVSGLRRCWEVFTKIYT